LSDDGAVTPDYLRSWGRHTRSSPLYGELVEVIAGSEELLRVINRIPHRPPPNVLFAAVQFLLMDGAGPELATFFPSLSDDPLPIEGVGPVFTEFVVANEEEIVEIGNTRYTQTNECRRCVALLPGIWASDLDRFHLIDMGTSAGLNLAVDRYRYRWGDTEWGPESEVMLETEVRGRPPQPRPIEILSRTGLDLHPVDAGDPTERRWLEALIWPEHHERRGRLQAALALAASLEMTMLPGSAIDTLGPALEALPDGDAAVVMHSFALNQLRSNDGDAITRILERAREHRPVHRVSLEIVIEDDEWARLSVDTGSGLIEIGRCHPHGDWVELYARP